MRVFLFLLVLAHSAAASEIASQEPFTKQELLDRSVASADAICIARLGFRSGDVALIHNQGSHQREPAIHISDRALQHSSTMNDPGAVGLTFLMFLGNQRGQWYVQLGGYQWRGGVFLVSDSSRADPVSKIRDSMRRSSVDSMAVHADVIALLKWDGKRGVGCMVRGNRGCQVAAVDSVLAGTVSSDSVAIFGKLSDTLKPGLSLAFLKSEDSGTHSRAAAGTASSARPG